MKLSIVTTLYKSASYIDEFYERITREAKKITDSYEFIFVNDGSPDNSFELVFDLYNKDRHIKIVNLSRNFGHHKAIMTGLDNTSGEYIFLIDCDLEEEPELLSQFWSELDPKQDIDVIYGVQEKRKGSFFEKWSGKLFYTILDKLIDDIKYPADTLTSRLMTKRYVEKVLEYKEAEYDLWSIFEFTGYKTKSLLCKKGYKKSTTYTFGKKMDMAMHIIVSTSKKPLQLIFYLGLIISIFAFSYLMYLLITHFIFNIPAGWTSVAVLLTFVLGIVIFSIGVLGIYISVIFLESKKRPIIIKDIYSREKK